MDRIFVTVKHKITKSCLETLLTKLDWNKLGQPLGTRRIIVQRSKKNFLKATVVCVWPYCEFGCSPMQKSHQETVEALLRKLKSHEKKILSPNNCVPITTNVKPSKWQNDCWHAIMSVFLTAKVKTTKSCLEILLKKLHNKRLSPGEEDNKWPNAEPI